MERFNLEQQIMTCWCIVDDIKALNKRMFDGATPMTEDEIGNYLLGLETIYQVKFEQLFESFEKCLKNNELK